MNDEVVLRTQEVLMRIMRLEPGAATDWHFHTEVEDFFVCLKGKVLVEVRGGGQCTTLGPGERCKVTPPVVHRVVNASEGLSEYLLAQGVGAYDFCRT